MPTEQEIEDTVAEAIQTMVEERTAQTKFKWTIVPNKSLNDGGLELGFNGWNQRLKSLKRDYIPAEYPYSKLVIEVMLVEQTYEKTLIATRQQITKRILTAQERGMEE